MEWFGEIPDHWEAKKINELFSERRETVSDTNYEPLSVSKGGIVPQIATVAKTNAGDNRRCVRVGDFVINSRSDRRGSSGVSYYDGSVSLINIVLTPRAECAGRFFHYLLRSHGFIEEYYRNGRGIVADLWTTRYSEMKTIYLPLPPRTEQDQIVRFLDWKVSRINKLINAKKKQTALLQEMRQAIINRAVTKGLNPNVPRKDSGVEWLGEVPEHWGITWIGHLSSIILGKMLQSTPSKNIDTLEKYFCAKDIHFTGIDTSDLKEMWFSEGDKSMYKVLAGDVLVVEGGAGAGGAFVFQENSENNYYVQNSIQILRSKGNTVAKYLYYWLLCIVNRGYIDYACQKATIPHYTKEKLFVTPIAVLPHEEQQSIVAYLDEKCAAIDKTINGVNRETSLLHEYRTRLISDVVTGKIDVHGVEVSELEAVDEVVEEEVAKMDGDEE